MAKFLVAIKAQNEVEQEHQNCECEYSEKDGVGWKLSTFLAKESES